MRSDGGLGMAVKPVTACLVVGLVAMAAACGGSDDAQGPTTTTSPTTTRPTTTTTTLPEGWAAVIAKMATAAAVPASSLKPATLYDAAVDACDELGRMDLTPPGDVDELDSFADGVLGVAPSGIEPAGFGEMVAVGIEFVCPDLEFGNGQFRQAIPALWREAVGRWLDRHSGAGAEAAYLAAVRPSKPNARDEDLLSDGYDLCHAIPARVDDPDPYLWTELVDMLGSLDTSSILYVSYDQYAMAVTHLCPAKKAVLDEAKAASRPHIGSGTWEVGKDIPAGTWQTAGDLTDCYWARLTPSGDIIDNNFASSAREISVTVKTGELFEVDGCGVWHLK